MNKRPTLYFSEDIKWRAWLKANHDSHKNGVYLIFYKLETNIPTMRWEEAVKVALCFGWIDSTVKSLGNGKRIQYFCKRRPKSVWSALNKSYLVDLKKQGLINKSGVKTIFQAKKDGSWYALDNVEKGIIPNDLQLEFNMNTRALTNFNNFSPSYRKSYLYWLFQAKRTITREKRIKEIVKLCEENIKSRS